MKILTLNNVISILFTHQIKKKKSINSHLSFVICLSNESVLIGNMFNDIFVRYIAVF